MYLYEAGYGETASGSTSVTKTCSIDGSSLKKVFSSLNSQINELVDVLNNTIIPGYESTGQTISKMFNSDFANQMSANINEMLKD